MEPPSKTIILLLISISVSGYPSNDENRPIGVVRNLGSNHWRHQQGEESKVQSQKIPTSIYQRFKSNEEITDQEVFPTGSDTISGNITTGPISPNVSDGSLDRLHKNALKPIPIKQAEPSNQESQKSPRNFNINNYKVGKQGTNYNGDTRTAKSMQGSNSDHIYDYNTYHGIEMLDHPKSKYTGQNQEVSVNKNQPQDYPSLEKRSPSTGQNYRTSQDDNNRRESQYHPYEDDTTYYDYNQEYDGGILSEPSYDRERVLPQEIQGGGKEQQQKTYKDEIGEENDYFYYEDEVEEAKPSRLQTLLRQTSFNCLNKKDGYYADEELRCEVFHFCQDRVKHSWLCPNGSSFHQIHLICMPPSSENFCEKSSQFHFVNDYLYKETDDSTNETKSYVQRYYPNTYNNVQGDLGPRDYDAQGGSSYREASTPPRIATRRNPERGNYDFNDFSGIPNPNEQAQSPSSSLVPLSPKYYSYDTETSENLPYINPEEVKGGGDVHTEELKSNQYEQYSF